MPSTIRAALVQTSWTGDKETMIKAHEEYAREAAAQGAQVICFQELFYGPVLLPGAGRRVLRVRRVDPRPDHRALPGAGRRARHGAWSCRCTSRSRPASSTTPPPWSTPTAPTSASTARHHIPQVKGFWEKFYFRPGNLGLPGVRHRGRQGRRLHLLRPALPRGLAGARPERRPDRVQPVGHQPRACRRTCGSSSSRPSAVANEYFIGAINRVGIEPLGDDDFYGSSYFVDPEGKFVGDVGDDHDAELIVRDLDLDLLAEVRNRWAFYRDRRPDAYERPDAGHEP